MSYSSAEYFKAGYNAAGYFQAAPIPSVPGTPLPGGSAGGYNGAEYFAAEYTTANYSRGVAIAAVAGTDEHDLHFWNRIQQRRRKMQKAAIVPENPLTEPPLGPTAPLPSPNAVRVQHLASQLRNARAMTPPVRRTKTNYGGGTDLT